MNLIAQFLDIVQVSEYCVGLASKSCTRNAHVHVTAATDVHQYTGIMQHL